MIDGGIFGSDQPCFGCSPTHPNGLRLSFEREGDEVVTRFSPGPLHQGPPTIMHGGLVTTLVDELAGWTLNLLRENFGFTGELTGKLLRPVPVGLEVEGRGRIERETHRVIRTAVTLRQAGSGRFCESATIRASGRLP
jgi:acyl-coenzyme A thioesterase PaaI-like protein